MLQITLALIVLLAYIYYLRRKRIFSVIKDLGIPGPEPSLLFGNWKQLMTNDYFEVFEKWSKQYGRIFGFYFGTKPVIAISDLDLLKKIQISDFHTFINRPTIFQSSGNKPKPGVGGCQLVNLTDKRWKQIRSTLTPSFTTSKMKMMVPIMDSSVNSLMLNIKEESERGNSIEISKLYQGLTMDVIGRAAFGIQTDCQRNPDDPFLQRAKMLFSGDITDDIFLLLFCFPEIAYLMDLFRSFTRKMFDRGVKTKFDFADKVRELIKQRRENASYRRPDLLQLMIDAEVSQESQTIDKNLTASLDNSPEGEDLSKESVVKGRKPRHMTADEIYDNASLFLLVGHETTSTALSYITHFLIHYPEVQERVRDEVQSLAKREGKIKYEHIQQLHYLDQVMNEALRYYPPVYFFVNREVSQDTKIGPYKIKKGITIHVPQYAIQHDPEYWPDPENFDPERFSPENKHLNQAMAFQPFGSGPRNCVGMRFATMEIKLALARILEKYRLEACAKTDKHPLALKLDVATVRPRNGIHLKAVPLAE